MASFDVVNYSLRPSKAIQRQLVFTGIGELQSHLTLERMVYIGFGSIWFTDFLSAHKELGVSEMISIEADPMGYKRAVFNAPLACIKVVEGFSSTVLPELGQRQEMRNRPWLLWLDYDGGFEESVADDLRWCVENAPENSILIVTASGHEMKYGRAAERVERLRDIFGSVVPDDLSKAACADDRMPETLADLALNFIRAAAVESARPGAFVPAFRLLYRDTAPMVTVGGILPAKGASAIAKDVVSKDTWPGMPAKPIFAPHLTLREASSLQSMLPSVEGLTREIVQRLGFDLEPDQIEAFQRYYRHYPSFAQIVL